MLIFQLNGKTQGRCRTANWIVASLASLLLPGTLLFSLQQTAPQPEPVGSDTCLACHQMTPGFSGTVHGEQECETCHGLGSEHVERGDQSLNFKRQSAFWGTQQCLACHQAGMTDFSRSGHGRNSVPCTSCHQIHAPTEIEGLLMARGAATCIECHAAAQADFRKPYAHPVLQGAMSCIHCHNPHADEDRSLRRLAVGTEEGCVSCHSDKQGPFVFEHATIQLNGCESCHEPHGSINPRMLRRTQVSQLCRECHSINTGTLGGPPPAFHDVRTARFRNCTICHRAIHGSNLSPAFLR